MQSETRRIVIVGGGTAGWITACLVAAEHRDTVGTDLDIVLVESPDIPTIGVGEGTWPSMRSTLQTIGLAEAELVRACDASFKQGTQFSGWAEEGNADRYLHPFSLPAEYATVNLAPYWLEHGAGVSFAEFVTPQASVINAGLAPKQATTPDYAFVVNYGYHFDAAKFADLLHRHAVDELGVRYVSGNVERVEAEENGDIAAVVLASGDRLAGDLFVDCSGQRGLLIGDHCGIGLVSVRNVLFNDRAIAVQVPYADPVEPIASVTRATAADAGWIWDIGLQTRRGVGYVFSTAHTDEATAGKTIRDYVRRVSPGTRIDDLAFRSIPFAPGYRESFWVRNCVAVGLAGGFVEPLEASALALIEQAATMIGRQLPADRGIMDAVARRFNAKMRYHWERVIEFLKLHYALTRRTDSSYWQDCRDPATLPVDLADKLALWQQQPPWHDDAPRVDELFPSASYQYVLYGMGFEPRYRARMATPGKQLRQQVDAALHANRENARRMQQLLPKNRDLVDAMTSLAGVA